jgi:hypothetical protein
MAAKIAPVHSSRNIVAALPLYRTDACLEKFPAIYKWLKPGWE